MALRSKKGEDCSFHMYLTGICMPLCSARSRIRPSTTTPCTFKVLALADIRPPQTAFLEPARYEMLVSHLALLAEKPLTVFKEENYLLTRRCRYENNASLRSCISLWSNQSVSRYSACRQKSPEKNLGRGERKKSLTKCCEGVGALSSSLFTIYSIVNVKP